MSGNDQKKLVPKDGLSTKIISFHKESPNIMFKWYFDFRSKLGVKLLLFDAFSYHF